MSDFVRTYDPSHATAPEHIPALTSPGQTGKSQVRGTAHQGVIWKEEYGALETTSSKLAATRKFLSYVARLYHLKTIFTISHLGLLVPINDPVSGSIVVNGSSQTGDTLTVTPSSLTKQLLEGDIISIADYNTVFFLQEDMAATMSGGFYTDTTLKIFPLILSGNSPVDGKAITYSGVKFRCLIDQLDMPTLDSNGWYQGLSITFKECP